MTGISEFKQFFPIDGVNKVYSIFEKQLSSGLEPDLTLFSIIIGGVENNLTCTKNNDKEINASNKFVTLEFPILEYEEISGLYGKFQSLIKTSVDSKLCSGKYATRELIKRVSDVIWNSLTRSYYKDRAHLQSIYSFLKGKKLDCFGVAYAVVAGCQVLGYDDVHLALSEDHAWVVFGESGSETAEVTWHGKGAEDKRGEPIGAGVAACSWLYVSGRAVICTRFIELAALVSSINPTLTPTTDVHEVAQMQHHLLWLLYEYGHLNMYPMALGNLGDLEEEYRKFSEGKQRPDSVQLYIEAIVSAKKNYANSHVYPYTFQGGYYHRHKMYKEAFDSWANAGDVIRQYNYTRDDEEIYKEFAEIANELIPQLMKVESSGHSARSILKDPQCFASLLRFYDGICKWEEGSLTPILHIGWAKPLVNTISKFEADVRAQVNIICSDDKEEEEDKKENGKSENDKQETSNNNSNDEPKKPEVPLEMSVHDQMEAVLSSHPTVTLYSQKMKGLKNLLLAEKLNTQAISLLLTAQSQLHVNKRQRQGDDGQLHCPTRTKRSRREFN